MLRRTAVELRRLRWLWLLSLVLLIALVVNTGYSLYRRAESSERASEADLHLLRKELEYLWDKLRDLSLPQGIRADLEALLEQKQRQYTELARAEADPGYQRNLLLAKLSKFDQEQAHEGNMLVLNYLLEHDLPEESPWELNGWQLLLSVVQSLAVWLALPAMVLGAALSRMGPEAGQKRWSSGVAKLVALILGLASLVVVVLSLTWLAGTALFGPAGSHYPVPISLKSSPASTLEVVAVTLLPRYQAVACLSGYALLSGLMVSLIAAVPSLLLGSGFLGFLLAFGGLFASSTQNPVMFNLMALVSHGDTASKVFPSELTLAQSAWLCVAWTGAALVANSIAYNLRASEAGLRSRQRFDWTTLTKLFKSMRWRIILLFVLTLLLSALAVFAMLGVAMLLYRLGYFHELFVSAYRVLGIMPAMVLAGGMVFVVLFFLVTRRITLYIEEISTAVGRIARGDLEVQIPTRSRDELGELAGNINLMASQLATSLAEERKAEQAKRELITSVSHDLRTPLTSVIGYLELISAADVSNFDQLQQYTGIAHQKAKRLQKMIEELFEFTRLTYGGLSPKLSTISLNDLLRQLADEFVPLLQQSNMEQQLLLPAEKVLARADGDLLARVLDNLYTNAIRYGSEAGCLQVSLEKAGSEATIAVTNYGPPIPAEDLPYIFERFYRVDKSRSAQAGGTGLGLAIAKQIVEMHGGSISATSHDNCTTFLIRLPVEL